MGFLKNLRRRRAVPGDRGTTGPIGALQHVAVIMDGNGRWAKERGLPRLEGHRAGARAIRETITACVDLGIKHLTLYTFSKENWRRPKYEVDGLMALFERTLRKELPELHREGVRIRVIGRLADMPDSTRAAFKAAEGHTAQNDRLTLAIALNYGARAEIVDAARALARQAADGTLDPKDIDEERFASALYTQGIPDPELVIRTGGDMRVSNFLLWQIAYSELWITPTLWPDFNKELLTRAVKEFAVRERRFGGLGTDA